MTTLNKRKKESYSSRDDSIGSQDLKIPLPTPVKARTTSIRKRLGRGEDLSQKKLYLFDTHRYKTEFSRAARRHIDSLPESDALNSKDALVTNGIDKTENVLINVQELVRMLSGCAYTLSINGRSLNDCDYYLSFSDKAYARKHLSKSVRALNAYTLHEIKDRIFDLTIVQFNGQLTLRITLRKKYADKFYEVMSRRVNLLAVGSTTLPFPVDIHDLNDAQKKRLQYRALVEDVLGKNSQRLPEYLFPMHVTEIRNRIWKQHSQSVLRLLFGNVNEDAICEYFGAETAFYFAWMNHYKRWMIGAGVMSLIPFVAGKVYKFSEESNPFAPIYTVMLIIGTALCVKMWERRCQTLFLRFNMLHNQKKDEPNWQFRGKREKSKITGEYELQYPGWKRGCILQPLSWCVTIVYMLFTIFVTICSANLDGMIPEDSFFVIESIRKYSLPGNLCGPDSPFSLLPLAVYFACTFVLSSVFAYISRKLTELENYKFRGDYIRALTQKRVMLEAINRYAKLFLVAFVCQNFETLAANVKSIFLTAEAIRLFTEAIIPFFTTYRGHLKAVLKTDVSYLKQEDENLQVYEVYQDFVEMALQLGYIALFATSYPIAPVVAVLSNMVEMKADLFKICFIVRRPVPRYGFSQLFMWCGVFRLFALGAAVTNTFLFVFTGSQIKHLLPSYFCSEGEGAGFNSHSVVLFTILEHMILAVCGFLYWRIPETPKAVEQYILKQNYLRGKETQLQ